MFQRAKAANKLEMVPMNDAKHIHFAANKHDLDTENLNSCTAVVIASSTGAILGHFSSRSENASANALAEDAHIRAQMNKIDALLEKHKVDFPKSGSLEVIAYAVYRRTVALPTQKEIIEDRLKKREIPLKGFDYTVHESNEPRPPGKGSVIVIHQDGKVFVFVEDKVRASVSKIFTDSSAAESSKASSR